MEDTVTLEAEHLLALPAAQARARFADHVARAFLADTDEQKRLLAFNAHLATQIRVIADQTTRKTIWVV